jgi:hypothetical protein
MENLGDTRTFEGIVRVDDDVYYLFQSSYVFNNQDDWFGGLENKRVKITVQVIE